ncbi:GNAT family N-acetyltransferase [Azorhizobium doebereinerae]|uniref:GNAT family N-acetyltransferase n=1 Tax=Azorhizobium doebereinerae TaxID=281091 RepID=UPI000412D0B6|nr:GNAT family N-acetyltransferase [Azorhizobium doebereinerae]
MSPLATSAITMRPATEDDLPAVLALYAQPGMDDGKTLPMAEARALFARFARYPDYVLYVAEDAGAVVGTLALLIMDNLGHLGAPSAIVEDVVVDPARQGGGVGGVMMRFAMRKAAEKGCYKLVLSSNAKRVRAHEFYEKLGFRRHGVSLHVDLTPAGEAMPEPSPIAPLSTEAAQ